LRSLASFSDSATFPASPSTARPCRTDGTEAAGKPPSRYIANNPRPPLPEGTNPTPLVEDDERKKLRYRMQNQAASLLPHMRVSHCCRSIQNRFEPIQIRKRFDVEDKDTTRFTFSGLQTCGSVHVCPHCAPYIASSRQLEVEHFIQWSHAQGLMVLFVTLTHSHTEEMSLQYQLDRLLGHGDKKRGGAIARFTRSKAWARMNRVGYIRRVEITRGHYNGWHPHTHWLIAIRPGDDGIFKVDQAALFNAWKNACLNAGLPAPSSEHGLDIEIVGKDGKALGKYIAKMGTWDISHEMTKGHLKQGKSKSRSPWQLLSDSIADKESGDLFIEYGNATKGIRSLIWSRGLKDACGLQDFTDQQIAETRPPVEEVVYSFDDQKTHIKSDDCYKIQGIQKFNMVLARGSRLKCLQLARSGGAAAVDEYIWGLIRDYRDGYKPFDESDPPLRMLPFTQPARIRPDS